MKYINKAIENGIREKLYDCIDIHDLSVAVGVHYDFPTNETFTRIVALVPAIDITVIKPASRLDMIKAAMPLFIRRMFPPKKKEEIHTIGVPTKALELKKLAALIYATDELMENPDAFGDWCVNSGSDALLHKYNNRIINVM